MTTKIYATAGDTNRVISTVLKDDDVARDLTSVTGIECHLRERSTGSSVVITGLTGDVSGVVLTTIASLTVGTWSVEFEVTDGAQITTYPGDAASRPLLIVRSEVA